MSLAAILSDPEYPSLKTHILEHTGLHYYADKDEDLAARVARRMAARDVASCGAYERLLSRPGVSGEFEALIGELTIGETYFFRQKEHFDLLRARIIPEVLERNARTRRLRIWSAGCATGAEPYSVAVLLWLEFAPLLNGWDVEILGTDINADFLAQARTGVFGAWALRELPSDIRARCFRQEGKTWKLHPHFTRGVTFRQHNLASLSPYPGQDGVAFDIILCRNVLIYFSTERIQAVAAGLYDSLAPGGWLLVGHAEPNTSTFERFSVYCDETVTAYQKRVDALVAPEEASSPLHSPFAAWQQCDSPVVGRRRTDAQPKRRAPETPSPPPAAVSPPSTEYVRLLADRGDWQEAEDACRRIIEDRPLWAPAHFTLGLLLEQTSTGPEAEAAFRRAIYLDRSFALAHYHLGGCLERRGQTRQARKSFDNVLAILDGCIQTEQVPEGEGITVEELRELAKMHRDLLTELRETHG